MMFVWRDSIFYLQCLVELEKIHPGEYRQRIDAVLDQIEGTAAKGPEMLEPMFIKAPEPPSAFGGLRKLFRRDLSPSEELKQQKPGSSLR